MITAFTVLGARPCTRLSGWGLLLWSVHAGPMVEELKGASVQATQDTKYLDAGAAIMDSLYALNWVEGGWASVQNVQSKQLEDHMPSYFLAEACKYLFLLFDDSFLQVQVTL